jgi:cytoplasmic iron level regulating protein YaaA (DUF328/UPF0246 family)
MIKILLAPSESKFDGFTYENINQDTFIFKNLYEKRLDAIKEYIDFSNDKDILKRETIEAIKRYNGVAFEALDFNTLSSQSQIYIKQNTIIFSNIFGPINANDFIPNYVFKQGTKIPNFNIEKFYKENFTDQLDEYLKDEIIVDLRAKHYEKYYKIDKNKNYITYKFIKNGKVVSHYAKKYRGILLRNMAINNIQTKEELLSLEIENLEKVDSIEEKNKLEIILEVLE